MNAHRDWFLSKILSIRPTQSPSEQTGCGTLDGASVWLSIRGVTHRNQGWLHASHLGQGHVVVSLELQYGQAQRGALVENLWVPKTDWETVKGSASWPTAIHAACATALDQTALREAMQLLGTLRGRMAFEQRYTDFYGGAPSFLGRPPNTIFPPLKLLPQGVVAVGPKGTWGMVAVLSKGPGRPRVEALYQRTKVLYPASTPLGMVCASPRSVVLPSGAQQGNVSAHGALVQRRQIIQRFDQAGIDIAAWF